MGILGILRVTNPTLISVPRTVFPSALLLVQGQPQVSMQHRCDGRHAACTYPLLQHQATGGQKRREIWCKWGKCC